MSTLRFFSAYAVAFLAHVLLAQCITSTAQRLGHKRELMSESLESICYSMTDTNMQKLGNVLTHPLHI